MDRQPEMIVLPPVLTQSLKIIWKSGSGSLIGVLWLHSFIWLHSRALIYNNTSLLMLSFGDDV